MIPEIPALLLGSWVLATIVLYRVMDGRVATLVAMIGGWALLPNEVYPASAIGRGAETTGAIHALAIPSPPMLDKASAIGLGCLLGSILFDWTGLRRGGRPRWYDIPMIAWCLVPIASALANGLAIREGLVQSRHLALAWGVPYLIGRSSFASGPALDSFARAWAWAGLATLPAALAEFIRGPFLYELAYGFHPYRFSGSARAVGNRPVLSFEAGNQFGMWAASAAVAAAWVWATGPREPWRIGGWRLPSGAVPILLVVSCLLWQSHSAIVLLLLGLAPLAFRGRLGVAGRRMILAGLALIGLSIAGAGIWIAVQSGGNPREATRTLFHGIGKASFTWRLARVAEDFPRIGERPLLGWGRADWSGAADGTFVDPVAQGIGVLAAGMYGAIGLASVLGVVLLPLVGGVARLRRVGWGRPPWGGVAASAAVLAVNVADLPMNSVLILPVLLAAGGLNAWAFGPSREREASRGGQADERGNMTYFIPGYLPRR